MVVVRFAATVLVQHGSSTIDPTYHILSLFLSLSGVTGVHNLFTHQANFGNRVAICGCEQKMP
jgi:hypothetical protein